MYPMLLNAGDIEPETVGTEIDSGKHEELIDGSRRRWKVSLSELQV
jgi:hypothetical protein